MKANGRVKAIAYAHHFGRWQTQRQMQKPQHSIPCTAHTHDELIIIFTTLWALLVSSGYCWQQYSILCPVCVKISLTESWISKSPTTNESIKRAFDLRACRSLSLSPVFTFCGCCPSPSSFTRIHIVRSLLEFSLTYQLPFQLAHFPLAINLQQCALLVIFGSQPEKKTLNSFILESVRPSTAPDQSLPNRIWKLYF